MDPAMERVSTVSYSCDGQVPLKRIRGRDTDYDSDGV